MRRFLPVLLLVFALVAGACASDDDPGAGETSAEDSGGAQGADDGGGDEASNGDEAGDGDEAAVTEMGTITINGDVYAVTNLNRCIPFSESDDDLDLQALSNGVKINLYATAGTIDDVSVDGSGVEAEYGSMAFGEDPAISDATIADGRTSGSATIGDSLGSGTTVDIEWDVQIPDEARDCSL
jgi:hypothetical protein